MTVLSSDHTSLTVLSGVDAGSHSYVVPREAEVFLFSCTTEPQLTETAFSTGISVSLHILLIMKVIKHKPRYTQTKQAKCNKSCTENFCAHINVSTWTESPAQTSHQSSICSVSSISGRLPDGCWLECVCVLLQQNSHRFHLFTCFSSYRPNLHGWLGPLKCAPHRFL